MFASFCSSALISSKFSRKLNATSSFKDRATEFYERWVPSLEEKRTKVEGLPTDNTHYLNWFFRVYESIIRM